MKQRSMALGLCFIFAVAVLAFAEEKTPQNQDRSASRDLALLPSHIITSPWPRHIPPTNRQGVGGIERTAKGRLWVVYGRDVESPRNYQVVKSSDDEGRSWSDVKLMILPRKGVRAMSASIWIDPQGRLWVFWGQSFGQQDGRFGIWTVTTETPDADDPQWSAPRRLGDGILLNKPTVLKNGDWLLPSSVWKSENSIRVYASSDQGKTFQLRGTANVLPPEARGPDEPMIVECKDGSLWMMVRSRGLAETVSQDGGKTMRRSFHLHRSRPGRRHVWLWLTKLPARMAKFSDWLRDRDWEWRRNLWPGTSLTSRISRGRVKDLLQVGQDRTTRFLSVEPQWEKIPLKREVGQVDWVIQGGESGHAPQKFDMNWVRQLRDVCRETNTPYFLKQLGENPYEGQEKLEYQDRHGGEWSEWPKDLRVREIPGGK